MRTKEEIIASRTAFINAANYALAVIASDKEKEQVSIITEVVSAMLSDEKLYVVPSLYAKRDSFSIAYSKYEDHKFFDLKKVVTSLIRFLSKECKLTKNGECIFVFTPACDSIKKLNYYGTSVFNTFQKHLEDKYFDLMGQ